jgi:hypothetical protein
LSIGGDGAETSPEPSQTTQLQDLQSIFDPNLFDSCFSNLASWDLTQPSNLNFRPPQRTVDPGIFSLGNSNEAESPELIQAISLPHGRHDQQADPNSLALARHSMELIFRVLKSWPKMLAEEFQLPPLFHSTQITPSRPLPVPLAKCITLTKMWHGQCEGAEQMVRETILEELDSVVNQVCRFLPPAASD